MRIEKQMLFWLALLLALVLVVGLLREVLLPFVLGIVLAYFLNPLADRLDHLGLGRLGASIAVVAGMGLLIIALAYYLAPLLLAQAQHMAIALPGEMERLRLAIDEWARVQLGNRYPDFNAGMDKAVGELGQNWGTLAGWMAGEVWNRGQALIDVAAVLLVTPLVMFYMLIDWNPMLAKLDSWLPRDHAPVIRAVAWDVNEAVSAFIRGQGTVCLLLSIYYAVALSSIGLDYGLLVGLLTGLLSFIPFVGWASGFIAASILAIIQFWPNVTPLFMVAAIFLAAQAMDAGFLSPKIVGSKIGLHPVWLILALFVFGYVFGFVGMLVAVPVAAAMAVLVRFALGRYLQSAVYRGTGERPAAKGETAA